MKNLEVNQGFPSTMKDAMMWAAGITAATALSWWVGRKLDRYAQTTQGEIRYPYYPREYFP